MKAKNIDHKLVVYELDDESDLKVIYENSLPIHIKTLINHIMTKTEKDKMMKDILDNSKSNPDLLNENSLVVIQMKSDNYYLGKCS